MFVIVSYDITDDRRRAKIAKTLLNFGTRVQKSVFECEIDDRRYLRMKEQVDKQIDAEEDSVRYYSICLKCAGNIQISGLGVVRQDEDIVVL